MQLHLARRTNETPRTFLLFTTGLRKLARLFFSLSKEYRNPSYSLFFSTPRDYGNPREFSSLHQRTNKTLKPSLLFTKGLRKNPKAFSSLLHRTMETLENFLPFTKGLMKPSSLPFSSPKD
jgi:hypothetical protein